CQHTFELMTLTAMRGSESAESSEVDRLLAYGSCSADVGLELELGAASCNRWSLKFRYHTSLPWSVSMSFPRGFKAKSLSSENLLWATRDFHSSSPIVAETIKRPFSQCWT